MRRRFPDDGTAGAAYEQRSEPHPNAGGRYAVLPDDCFGDIRIGSEKMDLWLKKNAILHEGEPVFAVYTILNGRYDNEHIQMRLYKRLKNDKNG